MTKDECTAPIISDFSAGAGVDDYKYGDKSFHLFAGAGG